MTKERTLLVVVHFKNDDSGWSAEDVYQELRELVVACHGEVHDCIFCRLDRPSPEYLIGEGKVKEISALCGAERIHTVIFSHDLKGSQQRNLEEALHVKTIDRTQLILDIFARRATSLEGKMQVELAQLEYLLPRLVGKGIALSRLGGGIGTLGPGETKLEVDRRRIRGRIGKLRQELSEISQDRRLKRKKRQEQGLPLISLVGYTNAGKSTLLNTLTNAGQITRDGLFTTLDPLSRQLILPNHQKTVISDTVGFMHQLPHHLIESFKATLEEVTMADLLLHVLDVSHPKFRELYDSVVDVLKELGAHDKPTITVLNKIDKLEDRSWLPELKRLYENPVSVSALKGENIPILLDTISAELSSLIFRVDVNIPFSRMDLVNLAHKEGHVHAIRYENDSIYLSVSLPKKFVGLFYDNDKNR